MKALEDPPTEIEIGELLNFVEKFEGIGHYFMLVRRMAFRKDKLESALKEISTHSVCCDARHVADEALGNG